MLLRIAVALLSVNALAAADAAPITLDFSTETAGAVPTTAPPLVGQWLIANDGDNRVLLADGQHWQHDRIPETLASAATAMFAERGAVFAQRIRARPDYPLAAVPAVADFSGGTISVRFKPLAGSEDQAAGVAFDLGANGDYFLVRANALENNLGFFRVVDGSRRTIKWVENTPTPTGQWHTLTLTVSGTDLAASLDGTPYLQQTLPSAVSGRIALWSKADSIVWFDDLTVTPTHP